MSLQEELSDHKWEHRIHARAWYFCLKCRVWCHYENAPISFWLEDDELIWYNFLLDLGENPPPTCKEILMRNALK